MKSIIREMYFDSIEGNKVQPGTEYYNAREKCNKAYEKLAATFTKEQEKLFADYYDADGDRACEWESALFEKGFKLGMILCMETLQ